MWKINAHSRSSHVESINKLWNLKQMFKYIYAQEGESLIILWILSTNGTDY